MKETDGPPELPQPPMENGSHDAEAGSGGLGAKILRGCAVAAGIAALILVFVLGACFISMSR